MREMFQKSTIFLWDSDLGKPRFGGHRYEEVTWYCWTCSPYSHIIQNEQYLPREMFRNSTISFMFEEVTLKNLGLEVTGLRKWLDTVEYVVPIVISFKMNSITERNVSKFHNFLMFEEVTLKSLGLESHRYEEVTWYWWTCSPYGHIIQNEPYLWEKCFEVLQFPYVWGNDFEKHSVWGSPVWGSDLILFNM